MSGLEDAKHGIEIVSEVIRLAGNDPNVKEAAGELGKTALTVTKTINNVLLPLAAVNFAFDKARRYFEDTFENDLSTRLKQIPEEEIIEPKASIAGPTLQGLAFSHEEPDLKELFLDLLACSMDRLKASIAHHAFVESIRQLQADEAKLLKGILKAEILPIGTLIRKKKVDNTLVTLARHVLDLRNAATGEQALDANLPVMVDNWIRLGFVSIDYTKNIANISNYDWLSQRPELTEQPQEPEDSEYILEWNKGILFPTEFGKQFARAVGLLH
jgi:hypothetical protein